MLLNDYVNATASNYLHEVLGPSSQGATEVINEDGNILIDAKAYDDNVSVSQKGLIVQVRVNGSTVIEANVCQTKSLTIQGGLGNDRIKVDPSVTFPLKLLGGSGSDRIEAKNPGKNTVFADSQDTVFVKGTDPTYYEQWQSLALGRSTDRTICIPLSGSIPVPENTYTPPLLDSVISPYATPLDGTLSSDQIQQMWNNTLYDSVNQNVVNASQDLMRKEEEKSKKLEKILTAALASGNLDMAVLLISGLETSRANSITAGLLGRIENLQTQRKNLAAQMSGLGGSAQDAQKASSLNLEASNMATEISLLQTFLQEVSSQKQEAQQMASNFIKNRHDTAMSILRNG